VSFTLAQRASCTSRRSWPMGSAASSVARISGVAAASSCSASATTRDSSSSPRKARPVADHSIDITEPARTFTVTGRPGSSKRTMVGPLLPITAMKQVTSSDSRSRIRHGSAARIGSACRMAASPIWIASVPR
jgi:hypothetical protein